MCLEIRSRVVLTQQRVPACMHTHTLAHARLHVRKSTHTCRHKHRGEFTVNRAQRHRAVPFLKRRRDGISSSTMKYIDDGVFALGFPEINVLSSKKVRP